MSAGRPQPHPPYFLRAGAFAAGAAFFLAAVLAAGLEADLDLEAAFLDAMETSQIVFHLSEVIIAQARPNSRCWPHATALEGAWRQETRCAPLGHPGCL